MRATWSATEPELGEERPGLLHQQPRVGEEGVEQGGLADELPARLVELADDHRRAELAGAGHERQPAQQRPQEGRLAGAVGPLDGDPLAPRDLLVERPEPERAALDHRAREACHDVAGALGRGERELQLPALPRLLHLLEPLDGAVGRPHLRGLLLGALGTAVGDELVVVGGLALLVALPRSRTTAAASGPGRAARRAGRVPRGTAARPAAGRRARTSRNDVQPPPKHVARRLCSSISTTAVTMRSRNARSCDTTTRPPVRSCSRKRSRRSRPARSRSLVGSSRSRRSWRLSSTAASEARAAWPPERAVASTESRSSGSPRSSQTSAARESKSAPPSARYRCRATS